MPNASLLRAARIARGLSALVEALVRLAGPRRTTNPATLRLARYASATERRRWRRMHRRVR